MYFRHSFDAGCHQVAHRAKELNEHMVHISEQFSDDLSVLNEFSYTIMALNESDALWSGAHCDMVVREHKSGVSGRNLWALYVKEDDMSLRCVAVTASSTRTPSSLGVLGRIPLARVHAPPAWRHLVTGDLEAGDEADLPPEANLSDALAQHRFACLRIFLLGRAAIYDGWPAALAAWIAAEGRPALRFPTMLEYCENDFQAVSTVPRDEPESCPLCSQDRRLRCKHSDAAILEEYVGHHLDVAQPVAFSTWIDESPLHILEVPPGLVTSPHVYSSKTLPGIPLFRPSMSDISGANELSFHRRIERWGRLAGLVSVQLPGEMRASLDPHGLRDTKARQKTLKVTRRWDGVYEIPTALVDLGKSVGRAAPATRIIEPSRTIAQPETTHEDDCRDFASIMSRLDEDDFVCHYASDIDIEDPKAPMPTVYPMTPERPFYQWDLAGDLQSRSPIRPGLNRPFHYIGSEASFFALHTEDLDTYSVNEHLYGSSKIWMSVPQDQADDLLHFIADRQGYRDCDQCTRHKDLFVSPQALSSAGITVHAVSQHPGHAIFTFPASHHQGFNTGPNVNIAVNYARHTWLIDGLNMRHCTCSRRDTKGTESCIQLVRGRREDARHDTRIDTLRWVGREFLAAAENRAMRRVEIGTEGEIRAARLSKYGQLLF